MIGKSSTHDRADGRHILRTPGSMTMEFTSDNATGAHHLIFWRATVRRTKRSGDGLELVVTRRCQLARAATDVWGDACVPVGFVVVGCVVGGWTRVCWP